MASEEKMSEEERQQLIQKLDKDFDIFLEEQKELTRKKREERAARGEPESVEEDDIDKLAESMMQHPAFMTKLDPSKPLSPEMEALQALQYETESAEDNATSYKEDGNRNFKLSKYRWARDNYTAGINCKAAAKELNAVLYSNRAAANYRLGNFRSAFTDCIFARKFKSDHWKAIYKGIQCSMEMKKYNDALRWCGDALLLQPDNKDVMAIRTKATTLQKQKERDIRKEKAQERRKEAEDDRLIKTIQERGVQLAGSNRDGKQDDKLGSLLLRDMECHHPSNAKVHLDENNRLVWPVMFIYPEFGQSDFIEAFHEDAIFEDHIQVMFGGEPAPWDQNHCYKCGNIQIYFEDKVKETLIEVSRTSSLGKLLKNKRYTVYGGMPGFIVIAKGNPFAKSFLAKYGLIDAMS